MNNATGGGLGLSYLPPHDSTNLAPFFEARVKPPRNPIHIATPLQYITALKSEKVK